jgi:menaquinone-dependent protoporphyrinogen IX oxidase
MNAAVVYDSCHGNTEIVARTIADELRQRGCSVETVGLHKGHRVPSRADLLFLGSPVRMGSTTIKAKCFLEDLDGDAWKRAGVVIFTTILAEPPQPTPDDVWCRENLDIGAGRDLRDIARTAGLTVLDEHLWVDVTRSTGPLAEGGVEKARRFARSALRRFSRQGPRISVEHHAHPSRQPQLLDV